MLAAALVRAVARVVGLEDRNKAQGAGRRAVADFAVITVGGKQQPSQLPAALSSRWPTCTRKPVHATSLVQQPKASQTRAVKAGRSVYFAGLADIVSVLAKAEREGQLRERIRFLCRTSLLIVDEIGYLPVIPGGGNLFFPAGQCPL